MWLFLILILVIIVLARGAYRNYLRITGQTLEKPLYYNGPTPDPVYRERTLKVIENYIRFDPNSSLAKAYPELKNKIIQETELKLLTHQYELADLQYRNGDISKADYEAKIEAISQRLNIEDLPNPS